MGYQLMASGTYTANVEVRDIPEDANRVIDALTRLRGKYKWELIREALVEYAENHKADVIKLLGADRAKAKGT